MNFRQNMARLATIFAAAALASTAHAAAGDVDITSVSAAITGAIGPITTIGSGVLVVVVTLKVFGWIRKAVNG